MVLCDTPCPEAGVDTDEERIERIVGLSTEDAVWEGVGSYYDDQLGRSVGRETIRKHFQGLWGQNRDPALVLNVHYLTTEHITVEGRAAAMDFTERALAEIDGVHRVLQRWFRAEGAHDPALVLEHFHPAYTMVTTAGGLLTLERFRSALPGFWGSVSGGAVTRSS